MHRKGYQPLQKNNLFDMWAINKGNARTSEMALSEQTDDLLFKRRKKDNKNETSILIESTSKDNSSARRKTRFETVKSWGFPWLEAEEEMGYAVKVWCSVCREFPEAAKSAVHRGQALLNADGDSYIIGTSNIKKDTAKSHHNSASHNSAEQAKLRKYPVGDEEFAQMPILRAISKLSNEETLKMLKLFDIAYFVAYHEEPFTKFAPLVKLERKHGVQLGVTYANDKSCCLFIKEIGAVMANEIQLQLRNKSLYFSIQFDSSSDKSNTEIEIVTVKFLKEGRSEVRLLGLIELPSGKSEVIHEAITRKCEEYGLNLKENCVGIAADGASVNFGRKSGVVTQLKQNMPWLITVHCVAHKLELAVKNGLDGTFLKDVDEMLMRLYYFYDKSPKHWREIQNTAEILREPLMKPTRSHGTRWVAHSLKAVEAVMKSYTVIVAHLEEICSGVRKDIKAEDVAKVKGYIKKIKSHKFLLYLAFYRDLLTEFSELSLSFQSNDLSLSSVHINVEASMRSLRNMSCEHGQHLSTLVTELENTSESNCLSYKGCELSTTSSVVFAFQTDVKKILDKLTKCLTERFQNFTDDPVLNATDIMDPANWPLDMNYLHNYGKEEIQLLTNHFKIVLETNKCDVEQIPREWQKLKLDVHKHHRNKKYISIWEQLSLKRDQFSNVFQLAEIILVLPIGSVHVERLFSCMKRIMGDWRVNLNVSTMECLVRISSEGPAIEEFDPKPAVERWALSGCRSRRPNTMPYKSG